MSEINFTKTVKKCIQLWNPKIKITPMDFRRNIPTLMVMLNFSMPGEIFVFEIVLFLFLFIQANRRKIASVNMHTPSTLQVQCYIPITFELLLQNRI